MTGVDFSRAGSIIMKSELDRGIIIKSVFNMATVEVVGITGGDFLCPGSIIMKSAFNFAVVEYHEPILVSVIVLLRLAPGRVSTVIFLRDTCPGASVITISTLKVIGDLFIYPYSCLRILDTSCCAYAIRLYPGCSHHLMPVSCSTS